VSKKNRSLELGTTTGQEERQDRLVLEGSIEEALPGTMFKVRCANGLVAVCTLSGKLRVHHIRLLPGDAVKIEVSPYDVTRGRVTWRGSSSR